jgi:antitoxin VapB
MPVATDDEEVPKHLPTRETPLETAARLRTEFGIELGKQAREPLPRSVYDELSGETDGCRRGQYS